MCPELLADIPYGFKSDIWSLGMDALLLFRPNRSSGFRFFRVFGIVFVTRSMSPDHEAFMQAAACTK